MEPEPHKAPIRFYEIDLLRFLAALSVVLYHYTYRGYSQGEYSPIAYPELGRFTKYGYLGVDLFFIISGYVVLLSAQGKTVRQFFISRIVRLYPAFWAACTITFIVKCIWGTGPADTGMSASLHAGVSQYVVNLTMLQDFFHVENIDGAYWSLAIEITFYFLVSLLIGYHLMRQIDWVIIGWLAFTALPSKFHMGGAFETLFFPSYAPYFASGMLFYLLQKPNGRTVLRYVLLFVSYLLAIRACKGHVSGMITFYHEYFSWKVAAGFVTSFYFIFYLIAFRKIDFSRFTWLAWLGALTYPLYLIHSDIIFIAFHRTGQMFNKYVLLCMALIIVLAIAYLIHVLIEKRLSKPLGKVVTRLLVRMDWHVSKSIS